MISFLNLKKFVLTLILMAVVTAFLMGVDWLLNAIMASSALGVIGVAVIVFGALFLVCWVAVKAMLD